MSFPDPEEEYFENCLKFFIKYQYLISVPNTHILVENVLHNIDLTGLEDVDLLDPDLDVAYLRQKSSYIDEFLKDLEKILVEFDIVEDRGVEVDLGAPMAVKKKYEVVRLAEEVESACRQYGCDTVVDLGSGLGYLDQRFHEATGLNVLGVEADEGHLARAVQRQQRHHRHSQGAVVYVRHRVDAQSAHDVERFLKENFKSHGRVCVTGLHACGDLTVDGIRLFLDMPAAKTLVLMPCCYHRMKLEGNRIKNFPLSGALRRQFAAHDAFDVLQVPFLRLAAHPAAPTQPPREAVFSLLARAVLQLYAWRNKCTLKRTKRRPVKKCSSFEAYALQAAAGYRLASARHCAPAGDLPFDMDQLMSLWASLAPRVSQLCALFVRVQRWAAPAAEALVLRDLSRALGPARAPPARLAPAAAAPRGVALRAVKD